MRGWEGFLDWMCAGGEVWRGRLRYKHLLLLKWLGVLWAAVYIFRQHELRL